MVEIRPVRRGELKAILPLVAGYQRFYLSEPDDERNLAFFSRFIAPSEDGILLGAWEGDRAVGFACVYWTFSSTHAARIGLMNDLFVAEAHRGKGVGRGLIDASASAARSRGAHHLEWFTATDNATAQRLYGSTGAERSAWFAYEIDLTPGGGSIDRPR